MRIILILATIICMIACNKKDHQPIYAPEILMAHLWYPYKNQVITIDSMNVTTVDFNGNAQNKNTVKKSDTSFIVNNCIQQSTYQFQQNGILTIKERCTPTQPDINSTWIITQTNMLTFPFVMTNTVGNNGYNFTFGHVTKIDNSEFIFNTISEKYWFQNSIGPNGTTIYESHKVSIIENMTYKSK